MCDQYSPYVHDYGEVAIIATGHECSLMDISSITNGHIEVTFIYIYIVCNCNGVEIIQILHNRC